MVSDEHPDATKNTEHEAETTFKVNPAEVEMARMAQWKGAIQMELQELVGQAADMRKKINEAKTQYKKDYYNKKFLKTQTKVMQMVAALQRIEQQEKSSQGAPASSVANALVDRQEHVHDENCQHDHEEPSNDDT